MCLAIILTVAYMFVKSFPDPNEPEHPSALIRIAVIAIGPLVWNGAVLLTLFVICLFLGPMMESWVKFASVVATLAHVLCLIGLVGFFELFVRLLLSARCHSR